MKHYCTQCGREHGTKGLCYFCRKSEKLQKDAALSGKELNEKLENLIKNIQRLGKFKEPESSDLSILLHLHGIISEDLQRAALQKEIYFHEEIFYHAAADIRDELIRRLLATKDAHEAGQLMACLAMQGDDIALQTLRELEINPRPWRKKLYVDPSVYAWSGGFTFDREGNRLPIVYSDCYALEEGNPEEDTAVRLGQPREDKCPCCGGRLMDVLTLDGDDPRLQFLGIKGKLSIPCCPNCVSAYPFAFAKAEPGGKSELLFPYPEMQENEECSFSESDWQQARCNKLVISKEKKPPFYGLYRGGDTLGGFGDWIQDCEAPSCHECGKPMRLLAQVAWETLLNDFAEGTLYISYCPDCRTAGIQHQQT